MEAGKVAQMLAMGFVDELLGRDALFLRAQHDGCAVGVIGADIMTLRVRLHFVKAHPNVGLDVFHQVAEMDAAVGIGERGGDQYLACHKRGADTERAYSNGLGMAAHQMLIHTCTCP